MSEHMTQLSHALTRLHTDGVVPLFYGGQLHTIYRCPLCHVLWKVNTEAIMSGKKPGSLWLDLPGALFSEQQQATLPWVACFPCANAYSAGKLEIDEYLEGKAGYGFNWEGSTPSGAHLLGRIYPVSMLVRQIQGEPGFPTRLPLIRAVLSWLAEIPDSLSPIEVIDARMSQQLAWANPPGHRAGTTAWCWKGGLFELPCPALSDDVTLFLAVALPPGSSFSLPRLFQLWKQLAALASTTILPGEDISPLLHRSSHP